MKELFASIGFIIIIFGIVFLFIYSDRQKDMTECIKTKTVEVCEKEIKAIYKF